MQGVVVGAEFIHERKGAMLACRQKAYVLVSGQKDKSRVGLRRLRRVVLGQLPERPHGNQIAAAHAHGHLREESHGDVREFMAQPIVRRLVQVFVAPQHRESRPIGEAGEFADCVVTLVMRKVHHSTQHFCAEVRRDLSPLRIQERIHSPHQRNGHFQLEFREAGNDRIQRDGIRDDGLDLRQQSGAGRRHKAGGTLAVHDRADRVATSLLSDFAYRCRMVVGGCLIKGPFIRREIDAGAPVLQPDVESVLDQDINDRLLDRCAEDIGANSRAVREENGAFRSWNRTLHVDKVAREAIPGSKGDDGIAPACYFSGKG